MSPANIVLLGILGCSNDDGVKVFNTQPEAIITSHEDNDPILEGYWTVFRGSVSDANHDYSQLTATWFNQTGEICPPTTPQPDGTVECSVQATIYEAEITLEVKDALNATNSTSVPLSVEPTEPPVAQILSPNINGSYYADYKVPLQAIISDAEDVPQDLSAYWESDIDGILDVDAIPNANGQLDNAIYLSQGEHFIKLFVEDQSGKVGTESVSINVKPHNSAPSCSFLLPQGGGVETYGQVVIFQGTARDIDVPYEWLTVNWESSIDGEIGSSQPDGTGNVIFTTNTLSVGTHVLSMTVEDEVGLSCTRDILFTIGNAPSLEITQPSDGSSFSEGTGILFAAEISDSEDLPSDLVVSWTSDIDGALYEHSPNADGIAQISINTLSYGMHNITASVFDTSGLYTDQIISIEVNGLPSAPEVLITPQNPTTSDDLNGSASGSIDPENASVTYSYSWLLNGSSTSHTSTTLPSSSTNRGEVWTLRVTPNDGIVDGPAGENSVTIGNAPPSITQVSISPNTPTTSDQLHCSAVASDPDETPVLSYSWTLGGLEIGNNSTLELLTVSISAGEVISCSVTATDSEGLSDTNTATVAVSNSAPLISTLSIVPAPVYLDSSPACVLSATDHDGSIVSEDFIWAINGVAIDIGSSTILTPVTGAPGDTLSCEATVVDNIGASATASTTVILSNSLPVITAQTISPDENITASETLLCEAQAEDLNGDIPQLDIEWQDLQTGQILSASASIDLTTVSSLTPDDYISCVVTATDAHGESSVSELVIQIENTDPVFTLETMITPNQSIGLGTELLCEAEAEDAEDGLLNVSFQWNNGSQIIGTDPTLTLSQNNASVDDLITCTASATDLYGATVTSSAEIEISEGENGQGDTGNGSNSGNGTGNGTGSANADFVTITAGTFTMGAAPGDQQADSDEQQHTVSLMNSFFMMTTEVSQDDFQALMGYNPSSVYCGSDCPVTNITWHEAAAYANTYSAQEELTLCYICTGQADEVLCESPSDPYSCTGYRLPTEAEWEYAAKAGQSGSFWTSQGGALVPAGEGFNCSSDVVLSSGAILGDLAWYCGNNTTSSLRESGLKEPNGWGLYDMHGNVSEWCNDWYTSSLGTSFVTDPAGPSSGSEKVKKGGDYFGLPKYLRASYRAIPYSPDAASGFLGFRLVQTAH
ncbi:MAG: hypothetical protein CMK59_10650 [Proteobacteria bacterium]|nr:hypothetical protein [Pseudomonadota bacterium]